MGALAHYLEAAGLATTQISLIRLHTEKIRPPRALWVPFELGRPLGAPNQPDLQQRVLLAALRLLEAPGGPLLIDFPEEAPESTPSEEAWACPVSFAPPEESGPLAAALAGEVARLGPWQERWQAGHGSRLGARGLEPQELARYLGAWLGGHAPAFSGAEMPPAMALRLAGEDLKAYYQQAALAQPGGEDLASAALADWFWGSTAGGRVLLTIRQDLWEHPDPALREVARRLLVPVRQAHRRP